jgi:SAM-dependent methyltransferase
LTDALLERTVVYRAWQAPFSERKFEPVSRHNDLSSVRRVLDVGCGPGTNTEHFRDAEYLGIDVNPAYVRSARERFGRDFRVADVRTYEVDPQERFDFILVNSFLHHIDTAQVDRILSQVRGLLTDHGHVHILELVLPGGRSVARRLARWDRGDHPRPFDEWERLFGAHFQPVVLEPYSLGLPSVPLWNMVYFKGRRVSETP